VDAAIASFEKAITLKPSLAEAHCNLGNALIERAQYDAALASIDKSIALNPDFAVAHYNRGNALIELKQVGAAIESFDRAITLMPNFASAWGHKALALLLSGDYEKGLELYEWRWQQEDVKKHQRDFPQPLWLGKESIAGKTILLHSEQGLGDIIQFSRYVKRVAELGARVILEAPDSLVDLLRKLEGASEVVVYDTSLPDFDCHCPLLSLPLAFKTTVSTIPSSSQYLYSDEAKLAQWSDRLGAKTKPRIGIVWRSSTAHKKDIRSITLSELAKHLPQGFDYISLQKELPDTEEFTVRTYPNIRYFGPKIKDFSDTAALCTLMDIVISIDTSVVHVAGALGKPVWVLLPYAADWRWFSDREDSPWYPSAKLYRQDGTREWASVLEKVKADLIAFSNTI